MSATHVVKLKRTGFETIVASGDQAKCEAEAARLNLDYQTDEYKVEPRRVSESARWAVGTLTDQQNRTQEEK